MHSVFVACEKGNSLDIVDEAWQKRSSPVTQAGKDVYDVPMGKAVGTQGESKVRIVTKQGTNEVVTAYPIN